MKNACDQCMSNAYARTLAGTPLRRESSSVRIDAPNLVPAEQSSERAGWPQRSRSELHAITTPFNSLNPTTLLAAPRCPTHPAVANPGRDFVRVF